MTDMPRVTYASDVDDSILQDLADAATSAIRIRVQPQVYDFAKGQYASWSGVSWTIVCANEQEAKQLREGLKAFFRAWESSPAADVKDALDDL